MKIGFLYVAIAASLAGTLGTFGVFLNGAGFSGAQVAIIRVILTAITLVAICPIVFKGSFQAIKQEWKLLFFHSLAGVVGFNVFFFMATQYLGVTLAVALLYTGPIWVLVLSHLFLGERSGLLRWLLALGSVTGVALILGAGGHSDIPMIGLVFAFMSAIGYALYSVLGKIALRKVEPNTLLLSSFTLCTPLLLLLPFTWDGLAHLSENAGGQSGQILGSFMAVSWLGTIVVFFLFIQGLSRISASSASIITTLEPLVATMLAVLLLGEVLTLPKYVGVFLIVFSAALIGVLEARKTKSA